MAICDSAQEKRLEHIAARCKTINSGDAKKEREAEMAKCNEDTFRVVMGSAARYDEQAMELLHSACNEWDMGSEGAHRAIKQAAEWHRIQAGYHKEKSKQLEEKEKGKAWRTKLKAKARFQGP